MARSFSGDKEQLVPLMKAALSHKGFALIDVISPCVTFNNHHGSTKSYDYTRDHVLSGNIIDFVPARGEITTHYDAGDSVMVDLHDGSSLNLAKAQPDYDPSDKRAALNALQDSREQGQILTGLIYINTDEPDFHEVMSLGSTPLNQLLQETLCPGNEALQALNDGFR